MLYDAMRVLLVDEGPLLNLYAARLPSEQTAPVDVAFVPLSGVGATRYLGSSPISDEATDGYATGGPTGVTHDGGVLWYHTGVQFQLRGTDPEEPLVVMQVADRIRNVLIQYAGASVVKADEEIIRIDLTTGPHYFGQDTQERTLAALTVEVWHKPDA